MQVHALTHSFIHSDANARTHSVRPLIHLFTQTQTHALTRSSTYSDTSTRTHSVIHPPSYLSATYSLTHPLTHHSFIHLPFTHPLIHHSPIHSPTHPHSLSVLNMYTYFHKPTRRHTPGNGKAHEWKGYGGDSLRKNLKS